MVRQIAIGGLAAIVTAALFVLLAKVLGPLVFR